jgi:hypothetical protein
MNKFEMLIQLILNAAKSGNFDIDVSEFCNIVDDIETESFKRGYIKQTHCVLCGSEIKYIDMDDQFRVQCECKKAVGKNEEEAYSNWIIK